MRNLRNSYKSPCTALNDIAMNVVGRYEDGYPLEHQHMRGSSEATTISMMIDLYGSCKYVLHLIVPHALSEAPGEGAPAAVRALVQRFARDTNMTAAHEAAVDSYVLSQLSSARKQRDRDL